jgi:RimJ/RimL family protein N-acetyltransferase
VTAVSLRPVRDSDLDAFYEQQADPESVAMAAVPAREREDHFRHWREEVLPNESGCVRAIVVDGEVAGHIVSFLRDRESEREVGYWVARKFWGRGVATAALAAFLAEEETRRPLIATVATHNAGSLRVLEKCGFEEFARVSDPKGDGVDEVHLRLS